jgi:hypothetical protein
MPAYIALPLSIFTYRFIKLMADAKHGRRAKGDEKLTSPVSREEVIPEKEATNLETLDAGMDESQVNAPREEYDMSAEVAQAPTEYHSALPQLEDLSEAQGKWSKALKPVGDIDLRVLMAALTTQLDDEDVEWNPDALLVQLNSELLDDQEKQEEATAKQEAADAADAAAESPQSRKRTIDTSAASPLAQSSSATDAKLSENTAKAGRRRAV